MLNAFKTLISLALLVSTVRAAIYVTNPVESTTCSGGQSCEVDWVDDGQSPLVSSIGECTVGLYNGEMVLVQSLPSVDVSTAQSLSFTPNPSAGPTGSYYIVFTSNSISYQAWSATFAIDGMTGSAGGSGSGNSTSAGVSGTSTHSTSVSLSASASAFPSDVSATLTTTSQTSTSATFTTTSGSLSISGTISASTPTTVVSSAVSSITTPSSTGTSTHTTTSTSSSTSSSSSSTPSSAAFRTGASHSLAGGLILSFFGALLL